SPLRHSRLAFKDGLKDGDPATLEVVFANEHQHDLFLADGDNRKSLRALFSARLAAETSFALTFSAETAAGGAANGSAGSAGGAGGSIKAILPAESAEAVIQNEPVIRTLLEMFEGRVLN